MATANQQKRGGRNHVRDPGPGPSGTQQIVRDIEPMRRPNTVIFVNRLATHHNSQPYLELVHFYQHKAKNLCNVYKYNMRRGTNIDQHNREVTYEQIAEDIMRGSSGAVPSNVIVYFLDDETDKYDTRGLNHNEFVARLSEFIFRPLFGIKWYFVAIITQKKLIHTKRNNFEDTINCEHLGYFYMAPMSGDVYNILHCINKVELLHHSLSILIDSCAPVICLKEFHGRSFFSSMLAAVV